MLEIPVLGSKYNKEAKSISVGICTTKLHYNSYAKKYTKRKHWIETSANGCCRYCHASYDEHRAKWRNPIKEKYYQFVAIYFDCGSLKKIYVHKNLHESYIREYLEKYKFDEKQIVRLKSLIDQRSTGVKQL